jgi:hypothetical protein
MFRIIISRIIPKIKTVSYKTSRENEYTPFMLKYCPFKNHVLRDNYENEAEPDYIKHNMKEKTLDMHNRLLRFNKCDFRLPPRLK